MIEFVVGLVIGGTLGVVLMALCAVSAWADSDAEELFRMREP